MSSTVGATAGDGREIEISARTIGIARGTQLRQFDLAIRWHRDMRLIRQDQRQEAVAADIDDAFHQRGADAEIMLRKGRVESQVSPLEKNKGRFEVHSLLAVAGVRGTDFRVDLVGDRVITEVLSGGVAVARSNKPVTRILHLAQGNVTSLKGIGKAVALLPTLGLPACQKGHRVACTAAALVHELMEARDEKRLRALQKQLDNVSC